MVESSGHLNNYVFYGKGRVEAAMRKSERHEMSEKVSVSEKVCSMRSLVRAIG